MNQYECSKHCLETLYDNNRFGWVGVIILMFAMMYALNVRFSFAVLGYGLLTGLGVLLHIKNFRAYQKALQKKPYDPEKWASSMMLASAFNGAVVGSFPLVYLEFSHYGQTYFITTILVMSMYGSAIVAGSCRRVHLAWSLTSLLPLSIALSMSDIAEIQILGFLLLTIGLPTSVILNFLYFNMNEKSYQLRMENLELIDQVYVEKEKAEQANKEKSRFLAATSHDLRQPLHALDLFLSALANTPFTLEQKKILEKAQRSSQSLSELLTALMDVSRLDAGTIVVNYEHIQLNTLLQDIVAEYKSQFAQQGIELRVKVRNVWINSDRVLLSRMIRNILSNALKHSKATKLLVAMRMRGASVLMDFIDNGIGIPEAETHIVFSEFYQINNTGRDKNKGLGLGLAIVKRLAKLLAFKLELFSPHEKGCHFRLTLPKLEFVEHENLVQNIPMDDGIDDLSGLFVLLIEDECEIRDAMRTLLKQWGCELLADESLEKIEQHLNEMDYPAPDILLLDYRLQHGATGLQALEVIRQRFECDIPAIIITGDAEDQVIDAIKQANCTLLNKPVMALDLNQCMARLVKKD